MRIFRQIPLLFSTFFLLLMVTSTKVFAACPEGETDIDIMCIPNTPAGFVSGLYGIGLGLIGGVSVLFVILGGYFILTSQGDAGKLATGRSYITYAVIGLLLAIFGYAFVNIVAVDILHIPGFN